MPPANEAQTAYWNDAAGDTWAALQTPLDNQLSPLGEAAMDALALRAGERIIDVGCGCGQTSLQLAGRVGGGGAVLGLDISRPMLEVARRRAADETAPHARFEEGDAQVYRFVAGAFDAVFSRFGVMFFEDPEAAFANIRTGLRSGGRLSFVCWRMLAENPWMTLPLQASLPLFAAAPPLPDPFAPGPFAFADPGRIRRVLGAAGFQDVEVRAHDQLIGGGDLETTLGLSLRVGPLGAMLRQEPEVADKALAAIRAALAPHVTDGKVMLPSGSWMVSARNP